MPIEYAIFSAAAGGLIDEGFYSREAAQAAIDSEQYKDEDDLEIVLRSDYDEDGDFIEDED